MELVSDSVGVRWWVTKTSGVETTLIPEDNEQIDHELSNLVYIPKEAHASSEMAVLFRDDRQHTVRQ